MNYETYKKVKEILDKPITENNSITFSELLDLLKKLEPLVGDMKVKMLSRGCFTETEDFLDSDFKLENVIDITEDWENLVISNVQL